MNFIERYRTVARAVVAGAVVFAGTVYAEARISLGAGRQASVGAYIYDLKGDSVVLADGADIAMTPASVVKSFTTASALQTLGKDWRFQTRVALTGKSGGNGVWKGDLVIVPGGDPTLESDNPGGSHGIIENISRALRDMNVRTITGAIIVADTVPDQGQAPDWENEDTPYPYGAGWFNLNWNDNTFTIWPSSGRTEPHVPDLEVVKIRRRSPGVDRGAGSERLYVYGPNFKNKRRAEKTTMPFPYKVFSYALHRQLEKDGVKVNGKAKRDTDNKKILESPMKPVYIHYSASLDTIMRDLMHRSDNTYAEGVLRAQAPGATRAGAIAVEEDLWRGNGLNMDGQQFRDGSGLSRTTSVTPHFIGDVLGYMAKSPLGKDYVSLFAVAGRDGTVKSLLKNTPLEGRLALKSGSMSGVRCYAGYALDNAGQPSHVVVLFVNRYSCSGASLRSAIEKFLVENLASRIQPANAGGSLQN